MRVFGSLAPAIFLTCLAVSAPALVRASEPVRLRVQPPIHELSGMVFDATRQVLWSLGDSGRPDSATLGRTPLTAAGASGPTEAIAVDAPNVDWEALTLDGAGHLWIVDAGDNNSRRQSVQLYEIDPQAISRGRVAPRRKIEVRYTGGPRNVEAAVVVATGDQSRLALIEKNYTRAARVAWVDVSEEAAPSQFARDASWISDAALSITDAALDGSSGDVLLLTYEGLYRCSQCFASARATPVRLGAVRFGQSESLTLLDHGRFLIGNEEGWVAEWRSARMAFGARHDRHGLKRGAFGNVARR